MPSLKELAARLKADLSIATVVAQLTDGVWARKSRPARGSYWRICPFHAEKSPSLHVVDRPGEQYYRCFGCGARGDVIDFVSRLTGERPGAVIKRLAEENGLEDLAPSPELLARREELRAKLEEKEARRAAFIRAQAWKIWEEADPDHPALETYLRGRLGDVYEPMLGALDGLPPSLRLHPALPYRDEASRRVLHEGPAMVIRLGRGAFRGIHRVWVDGGARATRHGEKLDKRFLAPAPFGEPAVLADPDAGASPLPSLVVGEGIETVLAGYALLAAAGRARGLGAEAALTGGALWGPGLPERRPPISRTTGKPLPSPYTDPHDPDQGWLPPPGICRVILLGEASLKCPQSAARFAERAAAKLRAHRVAVELRLPASDAGWASGHDFADVAASRTRL